MFILVVGRGCPSKKYIMNGIFEFDQAKALGKTDCKVIYVSLDLRSIRRWRRWGLQHFNKEGIDVFNINIPCGRIPDYLLYKIGIYAFRYLYKMIKNEHGEPDIIHAHFLNNGYIVANIIDEIKTRFIITEHLSDMHKKNISKCMLKYASYAYNKADVLLAVSPSLANNIKTNLNVTAKYIPNIVDTTVFFPNTRSDHKGFRIVAVGGLIKEKNMDLLIEAFSIFTKENENTELTIFGEGPERGRLEQLIKVYKLSEKVFLQGYCPRKEISEKMRESDLFVLVSQAETFGVAYIEALASGLPVIATKCGGPEGFINTNNGVLIPVNDKEALIEAFQFMYKNIHEYDGIKISGDIHELFSPAIIAHKLTEEYTQLMRKG